MRTITDRQDAMAALGYDIAVDYRKRPYDAAVTERVRNAARTLNALNPGEYAKMMNSRTATGNGSTTDFENITDIDRAFMKCRWMRYELDKSQNDDSETALFGALTFDMKGYLGVISLDMARPSDLVVLTDDERNGMLAPTIAYGYRPRINYVVCLIGSNPDVYDGAELLLTFHPGPPYKLATLEIGEYDLVDGSVVTVGKARELGFKYAKIV